MTRFIDIGQAITTAALDKAPVELRVDAYVDKDGYIQNANFKLQPIPALEKGSLIGPRAIVLHRTAGDSLASALSAAGPSGTHFYVDKDGAVHQAASLHKKTYHVGSIKSKCRAEGTCPAKEDALIASWGWAPRRIHNHEKVKAYGDRYPMNEDSVGIEVVSRCLTNCGRDEPDNATWEAPTPEQAESISLLIRILKRVYDLGDADIYEHDRISYKKGGEGAGLYSGDDQ